MILVNFNEKSKNLMTKSPIKIPKIFFSYKLFKVHHLDSKFNADFNGAIIFKPKCFNIKMRFLTFKNE